jgi:hypothetical protein
MFESCPKCGHRPLPADQSLPAACAACGVVLAKVGVPFRRQRRTGSRWVLREPQDPTVVRVWRLPLVALFAIWGVMLILMDHRDGEIGRSFLHRPLLVFHEAGHVLFIPFGEWMTVLGGTLGQLLMPAIMAGALLLKNGDRFGAALGVWLLGVSVLDVAPYIYDALHPQLTLLGGHTGEEGPHDWIYLLSSMGLLARAQTLGTLTHHLGALVVIGASIWAALEAWSSEMELQVDEP